MAGPFSWLDFDLTLLQIWGEPQNLASPLATRLLYFLDWRWTRHRGWASAQPYILVRRGWVAHFTWCGRGVWSGGTEQPSSSWQDTATCGALPPKTFCRLICRTRQLGYSLTSSHSLPAFFSAAFWHGRAASKDSRACLRRGKPCTLTSWFSWRKNAWLHLTLYASLISGASERPLCLISSFLLGVHFWKHLWKAGFSLCCTRQMARAFGTRPSANAAFREPMDGFKDDSFLALTFNSSLLKD